VFGCNDDRNPHHANNEKTMKNLLIVFSALFITGYVFTIAHAKQSPQIDEIDALLNKVSKNIQSAGEATKMAQTMNAKMVESKVAEKEALKADVAKAQAKAEKYAKTMMFMGVDTAIADMDTLSMNNMLKLNGL
jgi:inorganic pyrophosphatase/exopolyphosphatase